MRHRYVLPILAAALAICSAARVQAQFAPPDWTVHRGNNQHNGANGSDPANPIPPPKSLVWVWPPTVDLPAEFVVDNGVGGPTFNTLDNRLYTGGNNGTRQTFTAVGGNWIYPASGERGGGAWPFTTPDTPADKAGDYVAHDAVTSQVLAGVQLTTLQKLPNLGADLVDPNTGQNVYNAINQELVNNGTVYARWTMGRRYPLGTQQGTNQVGGNALPAPIRYAVYINFPSSGTTVNGAIRPNVDHVMVRVSWGANLNDPTTSRIFMMNFGQTGGFWSRVRTGPGDDRYFPYDGTNPLTVTVYALTPDDVTDQTLYSATPVVTADAVRFVPETNRGDIHTPAVSAMFTPAAAGYPAGTPGNIQLSYFGREETAGPPIVPNAASAPSAPLTGYLQIPFNPTLNPGPTNPIIADPSSSVRSAVFYCIEDHITTLPGGAPDPANSSYSRLRWRYIASMNPVASALVDNSSPAPSFATTGNGWQVMANPQSQPYGADFLRNQLQQNAPFDTATWTAPLPGGKPSTTYTVLVWVPAAGPGQGQGVAFTTAAHYVVNTADGPVDIYLNQQQPANAPPTGGWRMLMSGVRFPSGQFNGNNVSALGQVILTDEDVAGSTGNYVAADAVRFEPDSATPSGVVAAPLLANVRYASGTRSVVYFPTTDGHLWALDALGVGGGSPLTSALWVYPSISNPALNPPVAPLSGPQDDPNFNADAQSNVTTQGIDADLVSNSVNGTAVYTATNKVPDLGSFLSSPIYVEVIKQVGNPPTPQVTPLIVVGNSNGRLYAFDPAGRTLNGDPYPSTLSTATTLGIPGTTRREMTWPTVARDKWLDKGGNATGGQFSQYKDDPSRTSFAASPTAPLPDPLAGVDRVIAGAGDGHVYCVDLYTLDPRVRISNPNNNGAFRWQYPGDATALDSITEPGALSADSSKFVFSAGGRVYAINNPNDQAKGTATAYWTYPFSTTPPGNPNAGDQPALDTPFTAPVLQANVGGVNPEVAFVANTDGRIFAIDSTTGTNNTAAPTVLWTSLSYGVTRSSPTFVNYLQAQAAYPAQPSGPALVLPTDTGSMIGVTAMTGRVLWSQGDALIGGDPVIDSNGNVEAMPITNAWRGADAITANNWMYQGDEGNQDTGEVNGQMRAYADQAIGVVTPGEPQYRQQIGGADLRIVNIWDDPHWTAFGSTESPYDQLAAVKQPGNNTGTYLVYEWGDSIEVAAWGAYARGSNPPQVILQLIGPATSRPQVTVGATRDTAFETAHPQTNLTVWSAQAGNMVPAYPWVAKYKFELDRGSEADPQAPGTAYYVTARAQATRLGTTSQTWLMSAGQQWPPAPGDPAVAPDPTDPNTDPNNLGARRNMAVAHPLSLTTRGFVQGAPNVGPNALNVIGWTDGAATNGSNLDVSEIMANGDRLASVLQNTISTTGLKQLSAPVGMVPHGNTGTYLGVNGTGTPVPSLFIADRSNLYKRGHGLANIRVQRDNLAWAWNRGDGNQTATSNVMNPMPWEDFPYHDQTGAAMPQNASADYPDINSARETLTVNGIDMGARAVTLPPALVNGTTKLLQPVQVDLQVKVPAYQPANVNTTFIDDQGATTVPTPTTGGFLAPMVNTAGTDPVAGNLNTPALKQLIAPSGGYTGGVLVFVDTNRDGRWTGSINQAVNQQAQVQQAVVTTREEAYRRLRVGVGVPPDMHMRTEEQTIDLGSPPHSEGYTPSIPFAPSGIGPYLNTPSPWDTAGLPQFFAPFTVKNTGNVNLLDVRVAKIMGPRGVNPGDPRFWIGLTSDQVDSLTNSPIFAPGFNTLGAPAAGNIGVVTSLDHANTPGSPIDYINLWPSPGFANPYVTSAFPYGNWTSGAQPRPTIHKARPGDAGPTVMSIPDVAYGDPQGLLSNMGDRRPRIGLAIPLGTPAGTYSATMYPFEDHTPEQWRAWVDQYDSYNTISNSGPTAFATDDDGVLNVYTGGNGQIVPAEGVSDPTFKLKTTVREARLTNGVTPGSYNQLDVRAVGAPAFGANIQPTGMRDALTGNIWLYWASNRFNPSNPPQYPTSDSPWFLNFSRLNAVSNNARTVFDWTFASANQWWNPLPNAAQYPDVSQLGGMFPSDVAGANGLPAVPGVPVPSTERNYVPALARDDDVAKANPPVWLFWQGTVQKASTAAGNVTGTDTRTFYAPLTAAGVPDTSVNGGAPYSFRSDPELPRFSPRPIILTTLNGQTLNYLFWFGGPRGRTRLYYNMNTAGLGTPGSWSRDIALTVPGSLTWMTDPVPVHRRVYTDQFGPVPVAVDAIDLVYTAVVGNRGQAETILTRYAVRPNGTLTVLRLPPVDHELMVRQGNTQTWATRDLSWVIRYPDSSFVQNGVAPYTIQVNGTTITTGSPTYDQPTGKLYWNAAAPIGGQLVIDSQAGTLTFTGAAPRSVDSVTIAYVPQSMRLNSTRTGSTALSIPAGPPNWGADPGFALQPFVLASGSNTGPAAFIDRMNNPRTPYVLNPTPNIPMPVTRMWLLYRKSNSNVTAPAALYYKTMRLMVQLPRGVLRDVDQNTGQYSLGNNVTIAGNRGAVEVDWVRGRLYFTEADEGNVVTVTFNYARTTDQQGNVTVLSVPPTQYRVAWGDEITTAAQPADQTTGESILPTDSAINEGQVAAFKDPLADKVWVFWTSTRAGTTDLYYMTVSPSLYSTPSVP